MRIELFDNKLILVILLQFCEITKQCCEVITLNSNAGVTTQLHPDILGTYKRFKNHRFVYQHLSNPHSYIYKFNLKSGMHVVINNYTQKSESEIKLHSMHIHYTPCNIGDHKNTVQHIKLRK